MWFSRARLPTDEPARSLCWRGDELVDWVAGGDAWRLDGTFTRAARRGWGSDALNAANTDASGRWAVVHHRSGVEGLLVHDGRVLRELKRDDEHADAYNWPACLFRIAADERVLLAHCPEHYGTVEIDDAATGERLTASAARTKPDWYHSRLAASPSGKRLLSAGWVWQPWDVVGWLDTATALADPVTLDTWDGAEHSRHIGLMEESSAAWLGDEIVLIGSGADDEDPGTAAEIDEESPGLRMRALGLAVFDAASRTCISAVKLGYAPGAMMPVGFNHVLTFFKHPRLVSLEASEVVHEWSDLDSGLVLSSITYDRPHPVLALDAPNARFALQTAAGIVVVSLGVADLPKNAVEAAVRAGKESSA